MLAVFKLNCTNTNKWYENCTVYADLHPRPPPLPRPLPPPLLRPPPLSPPRPPPRPPRKPRKRKFYVINNL